MTEHRIRGLRERIDGADKRQRPERRAAGGDESAAGDVSHHGSLTERRDFGSKGSTGSKCSSPWKWWNLLEPGTFREEFAVLFQVPVAPASLVVRHRIQ